MTQQTSYWPVNDSKFMGLTDGWHYQMASNQQRVKWSTARQICNMVVWFEVLRHESMKDCLLMTVVHCHMFWLLHRLFEALCREVSNEIYGVVKSQMERVTCVMLLCLRLAEVLVLRAVWLTKDLAKRNLLQAVIYLKLKVIGWFLILHMEIIKQTNHT